METIKRHDNGRLKVRLNVKYKEQCKQKSFIEHRYTN